MSTEVEYAVENGIGTVTINRAERRNALTREMMRVIIESFGSASDDDDVRVVLLTGQGDRAFCAGADLNEINALAADGKRLPMPMTGALRNVFEVVLETYKPTIAVLNGPAVAGGAELALACDLRVAAAHAYLGLPEAKRGMGANFASVLLPRLLPRAVALRMLYTGEAISAADAHRLGLYNSVVPAGDLVAEAKDLAETIRDNAPATVRRYKEMATKGWELPVQTALRLNVGPNPYQTGDRVEGVRAFLEGRSPEWTEV